MLQGSLRSHHTEWLIHVSHYTRPADNKAVKGIRTTWRPIGHYVPIKTNVGVNQLKLYIDYAFSKSTCAHVPQLHTRSTTQISLQTTPDLWLHIRVVRKCMQSSI